MRILKSTLSWVLIKLNTDQRKEIDLNSVIEYLKKKTWRFIMPLVHVYFDRCQSSQRQLIGDCIHDALMETWKIPVDDRFQLFHEKNATDIDMNPTMWGMARSEKVLIIQITTSPRTETMKCHFYRRLSELLTERVGISGDDVFISLVTNSRADWSFGNGRAQLIEHDRLHQVSLGKARLISDPKQLKELFERFETLDPVNVWSVELESKLGKDGIVTDIFDEDMTCTIFFDDGQYFDVPFEAIETQDFE